VRRRTTTSSIGQVDGEGWSLVSSDEEWLSSRLSTVTVRGPFHFSSNSNFRMHIEKYGCMYAWLQGCGITAPSFVSQRSLRRRLAQCCGCLCCVRTRQCRCDAAYLPAAVYRSTPSSRVSTSIAAACTPPGRMPELLTDLIRSQLTFMLNGNSWAQPEQRGDGGWLQTIAVPQVGSKSY
jgi:hypothetical protein